MDSLHSMEHRVARFDDLGPPSGATPIAGFDELGGGPPDEGVDHPEAAAAVFPNAGEQADRSGASGVGRPPPSAGAAAPVAELGAADGQQTAESPTARLGPAGGRQRRHEESLLIVRHESGPAARGYPPDDQQRSRRARAGGEVAGRPAREPAARRGGPKQIDPDADPVAAAREICLRLLTDRSRTRHELAQALRQRGVPDDAAGSVLERFDEVGLIDDAAFAGQYVRSRHNHRGLARRAIAMELRRKGVDGELVEEALGEVDSEAEARRARELVDRKLRTLTVDTPEQRTVAARRLVGMLARKGYGGGTAYGVVKEALAAHGAAAEELGVADPPDD